MPKTATKVVRKADHRQEKARFINLPVPQEISSRLDAYCEETGATIANVTRIALKQFLDSKKTKN
jgi:predicted DNA-binding protein